MAIRVAVDAMGGDDAPAVVVEGAVRAVAQTSEPLEVLLFGPEAQLQDELGAQQAPAAQRAAIEIVDAPEVIGMAEAPVAAVKAKRNSSIHLGLTAHRQGRAARAQCAALERDRPACP